MFFQLETGVLALLPVPHPLPTPFPPLLAVSFLVPPHL